MRFEKINENKIRITISNDDLIKKNIDLHSIMANSIESHDLFFYCLKKAESEIGFSTENYHLRIEAITIPSSGDFILIITRSLPEKRTKKPLHIKKKNMNINVTQAVYCFSNFDDYFSFISFFKKNNYKFTNIADYVLLYNYNNKYYLVFKNINLSYPNLKNLLYCITEFSYFVGNSNILVGKLAEKGTLILKHNALRTSIKQL